jgi:hypothetical protein
MQFQQNICPHSVVQLSVLSSRHKVQVLDARIASGMAVMSKAVLSSCSAGLAGPSSASSNSRDTGRSSRYSSVDSEIRSFPLAEWENEDSRRKMAKRYSRRMVIKMPSREYEGGLAYGLCWCKESWQQKLLRLPRYKKWMTNVLNSEEPLHRIVVCTTHIEDG